MRRLSNSLALTAIRTTTTTMSERKSSRDLSQPEVPSKLALAHLKTVRWAQEQETLMYIFHATAKRYLNLKKNFLVGWYFLMIEVVVVWWWTFFHNFPMPQLLMKLLGQVDSGIIYMLDIVQRRIDWWRDVAGVRFMWFKESVVFFLDRNLTTADKYFAILQDRIFTIINYFMKPVRYIGRKTTDIAMQKSIVKSEAAVPRAKNGSLRRNSEGYEADDHEDWADEDYLSDASLDSRRLMKEDSRGELYTRLHTTAMAEGKFREAMYVRVRNELSVMRKNSIRFSTGIVNCVRQMVELPTNQSRKSLRELGLMLAEKIKILNLMLTIQENMSGRPFLTKPLILIRVLSEVWLAFLLRLVKVKKNRRSRSMRSESLRRRVLSSSGTSNLHQLSPAALQQSSEPVQPHRLPMAVTLEGRVQKLEEEEDLEGFLSKDSALGSEDNAIANINEGQETDSIIDEHRGNFCKEEGAEGQSQISASKPKLESILSSKSQGNANGSPVSSLKSSLCSGRQSPQDAQAILHSTVAERNNISLLKKQKLSKQKHVTIQ